MGDASADLLDATCGRCRVAGPGDAVGALVPRFVASPTTVAEAAKAIAVANGHGLHTVIRGAGTKMGWGGRPGACDLILETAGLDRVLEHAPEDFIARAEAGVPLDRLQAHLAQTGQELALDAVTEGATLGGVLATASSGPRRYLFGAPRDLVLGVTMVRADGTIARSGSRVVKSVAGYDLHKLLVGSYGTLGLIAEVTLRLHPLPEARRFVVLHPRSAAEAGRAVRSLRGSQLVASAIEIDRDPDGALEIVALFEGPAAGVVQRAAAAATLLGPEGEPRDEPPRWWGKLPCEPGAALLKLAYAPAGLADVVDGVADASSEHGLVASVRGSAGAGVLSCGVAAPVSPERFARFLARLREVVARHDGSVVVVDAPPDLRDAVDLWGPVRGLELMRRIKSQFDPSALLAPGRFVGGI